MIGGFLFFCYLVYDSSMTFATIIFLLIVFIGELLIFIIIPMTLHGAPYMPSRRSMVKRMMDIGDAHPGDLAVDLGSGDGRFMVELAKRGIEAHGYEINPFLVLLSKWNIYRAGVGDKAKVFWKNLWDVDVSKYSLVFLFQLNPGMEKLEEKLQKELKPGARVVSNSWSFPHWPIDKKDYSARLYIKKS